MLKSFKAKTLVHVRYMVRDDLSEVVRMERDSFGDLAWEEEDFLKAMRCRSVVGMVAEKGDVVVGFFVYELHKDRLQLIDLAVHPDHRRCGVGAQMVSKLASKLSSHGRRKITAHVRETNLPAQQFLRATGFLATSVLRRFFGDDEDAYRMEWDADGQV